MKTIAIVNATNLSPFALKEVFDKKSAFSIVLDFCKSFAEETIVLSGNNSPITGIKTSKLLDNTMNSVLSFIKTVTEERPNIDTILYVHGDTPFLDIKLAKELLDMHKFYRAEYSFADGYPAGFSPEILSKRCIPNLSLLAERHNFPADKAGLFAVIQKDINSFDIETKLSPLDLRAYRLNPVCDSKRNTIAAEKLWALGARSAEDAVKLIPGHLELLRTIPAFLSIQTTEACLQACSYCPYPLLAGDPRKLKGFMPVDKFSAIITEAKELWDDIVVDLSLWGELSVHPDCEEIVNTVMSKEGFSLIIETSGLGWKNGLAESLSERWKHRLQWIISIDDATEEGYQLLRGNGWQEANSFAKRLIEVNKSNVHVQAVRMQENEARLETFYRAWKQLSDNVIIQKYDSFSGSLPDRSVANLAPIKRLPCRHLARDLSILLDGSVPVCKHSLIRNGSALSYAQVGANVFTQGLEKAWDSLDNWYNLHAKSNYPEVCRYCDEYYTFNA